jgi:hypothetical protein
MDVFKRFPYIKESILISEKNFSEYTKKAKPYYSSVNGIGKYYAVCPVCDNPIQIIGLYKSEEGEKRAPFGKHYKGDIKGLAKYNDQAYHLCPYHNPYYQGKRMRRAKGNKTSNAIYNYLINYFDEIIKKLEERIHIKISYTFAKELKESFLLNAGWEYYDCTYDNLPLMLLYAQPAYTLVKRRIRKNTEISKMLGSIEDIILEDIEGENYLKVEPKSKKFVELSFMVCNHKKEIKKERLIETFKLLVYKGNQKIYSETIVI